MTALEVRGEPEQFPPERIRADDDALAQAGRVRHATVALDRSGPPVAYNEVLVAAHEAGRAFQWGTLALPGHRGHRLGLAVKARTLQLLAAEQPGLRTGGHLQRRRQRADGRHQRPAGVPPRHPLGELQRRL